MIASRPSILLICDSLELGGSQVQFAEVASRLAQSRWNLHVSCLRVEGPLREKLGAAGIQPFSCGRGSLKPLQLLPAAWSLARYLRANRIRLVHCFDFYSNVLGVVAGRIAMLPAVIASQRDLGNLQSGIRPFAQRAALRFATHVVVNAEAIRRKLLEQGHVAAKRILLVRNGVDLARFRPRERALNHESNGWIGTLAQLRPEKGLDDLLRAAAHVAARNPRARFVIWGDGPLRSNLERLARDLGVAESVRFAGSTLQTHVVLKDLRIFVLPSTLSEGISNALLEAMAVGVPVIATSVGGNVELVEHGRTGLLVRPGAPEEMAAAVSRLIEEPDFAAQLAREAQERVRAEFGMEQMMGRLEACYLEALEGR